MNAIVSAGVTLFGRLRIVHRLLLVLACAGVGATLTSAIVLATLYQNLIEDRQQTVRNLVDVGYSTIAHWAGRAERGEVSLSEAQAAAKAAVAALRYGADDYFWINDYQARMVMHPLRPELDGSDLSGYLDKRGKALFRAFVEIAQRDGAGFVDYYWPRPGGEAEVAKLSYVKGFKPWGWIVGSGIYVDDVNEIFQAKAALAAGLVLATLLVVGVVAVAIARSIARPVERLTAATTALSQGRLDTVVPDRERRDEIGAMAEAVQVFKQSMAEAAQLRAEQAQEHAVQQRRARTLEAAVAGFEAAAGGVVKAVATAAAEMQSQARTLAATAQQTSEQATAVAAASQQATANIETVAAAGEQLSSSITEIGRQVSTSTRVSGEAVAETEKTDTQVHGLAEAAQRIGDVVRLINDIAGQTNLLALNATIEAARAGEAGKGFAVVATEVKNLANQTAKATDDIGQQVAAIQSATRESVEAIQAIAATIAQVNEIATAIAAAVEEQQAATSEIARNVQQAARGTQDVLGHIGAVTDSAAGTGQAADRLLEAASELSRQAGALRDEVDEFLGAVRAA